MEITVLVVGKPESVKADFFNERGRE